MSGKIIVELEFDGIHCAKCEMLRSTDFGVQCRYFGDHLDPDKNEVYTKLLRTMECIDSEKQLEFYEEQIV